MQLLRHYPRGYTSKTFAQMHVALPQDVRLVGRAELQTLEGIDLIGNAKDIPKQGTVWD